MRVKALRDGPGGKVQGFFCFVLFLVLFFVFPGVAFVLDCLSYFV